MNMLVFKLDYPAIPSNDANCFSQHLCFATSPAVSTCVLENYQMWLLTCNLFTSFLAINSWLSLIWFTIAKFGWSEHFLGLERLGLVGQITCYFLWFDSCRLLLGSLGNFLICFRSNSRNDRFLTIPCVFSMISRVLNPTLWQLSTTRTQVLLYRLPGWVVKIHLGAASLIIIDLPIFRGYFGVDSQWVVTLGRWS